MRIETFEMERMQSTWENLVDYDMSESGVRPLTLRELTAMGFDLESFLDVPLGYSQSNGTIELRERIAALYPGATADHVEVTNGTSEANYIVALSRGRGPATSSRCRCPTTCRCGAWRAAWAPRCKTFTLRTDASWEPDWDEFERAVTREDAPPLPVESQQPDRLGAVRRRDAAHRRSLPADRHVAARPTRSTSAPRSPPARARRASGGWAIG